MLYIRAGMLPWLSLIEWEGAVPDLNEDSQGASFQIVTSPESLARLNEHGVEHVHRNDRPAR